jgi:uncharacterized membrane protein YhhN
MGVTGHAPRAAGPEPGGGHPPRPHRRSRLAVAALIAGLAQWLSWFLLLRWTIGYVAGLAAALLAMCLGIAALRQTRKGPAGERGIAVAGIALGAAGLLWPLLFVLMLAAVGGIGVPM